MEPPSFYTSWIFYVLSKSLIQAKYSSNFDEILNPFSPNRIPNIPYPVWKERIPLFHPFPIFCCESHSSQSLSRIHFDSLNTYYFVWPQYLQMHDHFYLSLHNSKKTIEVDFHSQYN
jgi:hypothetical protein